MKDDACRSNSVPSAWISSNAATSLSAFAFKYSFPDSAKGGDLAGENL